MMLNLTTDLRFINEPEPNFEYYYVIRMFAVIQLIAEILTVFHVFYVLIIFIKVKVCHIHFRILTCVFLFDLILKAVTNSIVLSKLITRVSLINDSSGYFFANVIQCTANYIYYFYPFSIFVERTIPLILAKSYENFFSVVFVFISVMVPILCGLYITIHLFFLQAWVPILTIYMTSNFFMITSWVAYFLIYFSSKKFTKKNKVQTVSERYQRFESSRTHKTMNWFVVSCMMSLLLAAACIHFLRHYELWFPTISETNMIAMVRIILDTAQAYLFLVIPVAFTFTHDKLKKKYLQIFKCSKSSTQVTSTVIEMQVIKSVTGKNMIPKNQQEYYFKSLAADWDTHFNRIS